jgi:hypothetical protein
MRTAKKELERPEMRPPMREDVANREDDHMDRAARRIAELRGHNNANLDEGIDKFKAPEPPPGWSYEWKMKNVMGWEDPSHHNRVESGGWEAVSARRHPEMMPKGYSGAIEREGMVLCERPAEITNERKQRDLMMARQQVRIKEGQLTNSDGLLGREDSKVAPKIKKGYEPMQIPD